MDRTIETLIDKLGSADNKERFEALQKLLAATEQPVDWFPEAADSLTAKLDDPNFFQCSVGVQMLCNLAKNDRGEYTSILPGILKVLNSESFIARRQTIQNLWKIAIVKPEYAAAIETALTEKYRACLKEEHPNLIRIDIISTLCGIVQKTGDKALAKTVETLIAEESDEKNRKKMMKLL